MPPGAVRIGAESAGGEAVSRRTALPTRLAQVLPLIAEGLTDYEIGRRLNIATGTVRGIAQRLVIAYSATNRAHMIARAFRQGDLT